MTIRNKTRFNLALDSSLYSWVRKHSKSNKTTVTAIITAFLLRLRDKEENMKPNKTSLDLLKKFVGKNVIVTAELDLKEVEVKDGEIIVSE